MDMVTRMAEEHPVVIFSKSSCCIGHSMTSLISSFGVKPTVHEIDKMPDGQEIEGALILLGRQPSVPAVFVGNRLIGGAKEVMSLHLRGNLA